jgi:hypothetical protein
MHTFNPDHRLYCQDCGYGELAGDHGMIPGPSGPPIPDPSLAVVLQLASGSFTSWCVAYQGKVYAFGADDYGKELAEGAAHEIESGNHDYQPTPSFGYV